MIANATKKKSANKLYQEYKSGGGKLSFVEWGEKFFSDWRTSGSEYLNQTGPLTGDSTLQQDISYLHTEAGYKTDLDNKYIFGIDRRLLLTAGVGLLLIAAFIIYNKKHRA